VFYKIFTNSIGVIKEFGNHKIFSSEEVVGASLMLAIAIAGIGDLAVFGFSIRNILAILLVLILGWKNGILVGATSGITIGVMLGLMGVGDTALVASFAFSGLLAGIFSRFGRIGVIVGFVLGNIILTFVANGSTVVLVYFREILIASIGLLAMPKKLEINIEDLIGRTKALPETTSGYFEKTDETVHKLSAFSEVIEDLAEGFDEAAVTTVDEFIAVESVEDVEEEKKVEINISGELEKFTKTLKNNIEYNEENKVHNVLINDVILLNDIFTTLKSNEDILKEEFKSELKENMTDDDFKNIEDSEVETLVFKINEAYRIHKINLIWEKRIYESRQVAKDQLSNVSRVLSRMAEDLKEENKKEKEEEIKGFADFINIKGISVKKEFASLINDNNNKKFDIQMGISRTTKNDSDISEDSNISTA